MVNDHDEAIEPLAHSVRGVDISRHVDVLALAAVQGSVQRVEDNNARIVARADSLLNRGDQGFMGAHQVEARGHDVEGHAKSLAIVSSASFTSPLITRNGWSFRTRASKST